MSSMPSYSSAQLAAPHLHRPCTRTLSVGTLPWPALLPLQVESLLSVLCEETDIAEVELKMGGFKMRVRRSINGAAAAPAAAAAAPAAVPAPAPAPAPVAAAPAAVPAASVETADEDESLLDVTANKVSAPACPQAWLPHRRSGRRCASGCKNQALQPTHAPAAAAPMFRITGQPHAPCLVALRSRQLCPNFRHTTIASLRALALPSPRRSASCAAGAT